MGLPEFRRKLLIYPTAFPTGLAWPEMTFVEHTSQRAPVASGMSKGGAVYSEEILNVSVAQSEVRLELAESALATPPLLGFP